MEPPTSLSSEPQPAGGVVSSLTGVRLYNSNDLLPTAASASAAPVVEQRDNATPFVYDLDFDTNYNTNNNANTDTSIIKQEKEDSFMTDQEGEEEAEATFIDPADLYPLREVRYGSVSFNPVVTTIGIVVLWGLSVWCMADPTGSFQFFTQLRARVTLHFTWLFVGSKVVFFFFLLWVAVRYGHIRLGPQPPAFSNGTYFCMVFASGVAVGLFVFGVSEPLAHHDRATAGNYVTQSPYRTQDERDVWAINLAVTHWNIAGWAPYAIVSLATALAGHRFRLPMTFRSCFYPLLGDYTWGWMGDLIDGWTIVVTVAGVCTSLGLGVAQIVDGLVYLGWMGERGGEEGEEASAYTFPRILTLWIVTIVATGSVVSGLDRGIKFLSLFAFILGVVLEFAVFIMDDSKYIMNVIVQELGAFFQYSIFFLNSYTGAFSQLPEGSGRAIDGNAESVTWMNEWAIFYQAWWVSWSAFVGLFVARISRGRTIWEMLVYSLFAPCLYCAVWFSVWGGVGIRQARQAMEIQQFDAEQYAADRPGCFHVPTDPDFGKDMLKGVTPVCLYQDNSGEAPFNVLYSFSYPDELSVGFGPFLSVLFLLALVIYFVTSSDSGSLVVDYLASNGRLNHHWGQRMFWALTEGAVATALLVSGGRNSLSALQAAAIVAGLPFVVLLCFQVQSIYLFCERASESDTVEMYQQSKQPEFPHPIYGGVFNCFEYFFSLGSVHEERVKKGMDVPSPTQVKEFFKGLIVPFVSLNEVLSATYPRNVQSNRFVSSAYGLLFYSSWIILIVAAKYRSLYGVGWTLYFGSMAILMNTRNAFRRKNGNLRSNVVADFLGSLFFWPQVLSQMLEVCHNKKETSHRNANVDRYG